VLPHEFNKKDEDLPVDGRVIETAELLPLRNSRENAVKRLQEPGEHKNVAETEKW
jgi:hypothetical protein